MKFTFKKEPSGDNIYDTATVEVYVEAVALDEILIEFGHFLKGCGFILKRPIEVVEEEE